MSGPAGAALGLTLPMLHRPGLILRTRPVAARLRHILASPLQEVRQVLAGRLIAPLTASHQADQDGPAGSPGDLAAAALERIHALLPGVGMELAEVAAALRPVPGDGLPAVGPTGTPGLWLAVLHSEVTLAGIVAEVLTAQILGGAGSPLLVDFRPGRFF